MAGSCLVGFLEQAAPLLGDEKAPGMRVAFVSLVIEAVCAMCAICVCVRVCVSVGVSWAMSWSYVNVSRTT